MQKVYICLVINIIFIIITIICEKTCIRSIIFWSLIILLFGFLGFFAYVIFGNKLKFKAKKQIINKKRTTKNYLKHTSWYGKYQQNKLKTNKNNYNILQTYFKNKLKAEVWHNNKIKIYNSGESFLKDFLQDLTNAKSTINLQFYIFAADSTGFTVAKILKQKAKEGVRINVLYDEVGSRKTPKKFWQNLKKYNINVASFFPNSIVPKLNLKINYRNHRKIAVIDGNVSYLGGINLRDDHMGKNKKLAPWRDTHIKLQGNATYAIQNTFLNDWLFANNEKADKNLLEKYFVKPTKTCGANIQIISSGPEQQNNKMEMVYLKIIKNCSEFLFIQSPYFIVKQNFIKQIISAKNRGVNIAIIIPQKADKKIVYAGTIKCVKQLVKSGVKVFLYKGFIHSKVVLTENILSIGSANFDNRSMELNFETNALIYEKQYIDNYKQIFYNDLNNCISLTNKKIKKLETNNFLFNLLYKIFYRLL